MIRNINRNRAVPLCFLTDLFKVTYDLLSVVEDLKKAGVEIEHDQRVQYAFDIMSRITGVAKPSQKPIVVPPAVIQRQPNEYTAEPTQGYAVVQPRRRAGDY
tara:strand:+ start:248 stop:553 length:306 start_codon:yes stop_codon:yes gene_type:complete